MKWNWDRAAVNILVPVAVGVRSDGYRQIAWIQERHTEDKTSWSGFLVYPKRRMFGAHA
ncbi:transposase [Sedimenticola thiotaurini]|uniref:transposase n=1 Tax=Sedimenticola thiotaurini TaxID=1543721 RepID=UPI003AAF5572